jgi:hypothetical protein
MRVLLGSGLFESQLLSFREHSYSKELALLGRRVISMCGDRSYVWNRSRVRLPVTDPTANDRRLAETTDVCVLRHTFSQDAPGSAFGNTDMLIVAKVRLR